MQQTICLYDEKPYEVKFTGKVLACEENGEKGYKVVVDQTQFFPEQGGQTPDRGMLGEAQVLDVQIEDGVIYHYTDKALDVGEKVEGTVNWEYRFSNMQQHTGEHIFSGLVHAKYGYENVGFHLSDSVVTMDFDGPLDGEQIKELEMKVNEVIWKNIPVQASFPDDATLAAMEYRSKKELEGPIRIVTIPEVDVCACCAPHVQTTGEIGVFRVMNLCSYKGGVRISMLCGKRALEALQQQGNVVAQLMNALSSSQEDLPQHVERLQKECQDLRYEISSLKEKMVMEQVRQIPAQQKDVLIFMEGLDARAMRNAVNALMEEHAGFCGVFSGTDETEYQFVIGSKNLDCRELANELRGKLQFRGGGNQTMIQGSLSETEEETSTAITRYRVELTH